MQSIEQFQHVAYVFKGENFDICYLSYNMLKKYLPLLDILYLGLSCFYNKRLNEHIPLTRIVGLMDLEK